MEVLHRKCAGLDVHKDTVVACVRRKAGRQTKHEVRTYGTMTWELESLSDWLEMEGVTHVAMESTGVYWKPVWHVLEDGFELVLANAAHIRNVPGRKSDVNDAMWIADLLAHGLIRPSFVPPAPTQEVRMLTRTRKQLSREVAQHTLRVQKVLEDANLKLSSVASDVLGASGRAILRGIIAGVEEPEKLADLAEGRLRSPREALVEALRGKVRLHHRTLLRLHLEMVEAIEAQIAGLERDIRRALDGQERRLENLCTMPGLATTSAQSLLAEVGTDMSRFPSPGHLVSWAGLCPGLNESAGRKKSTRLRAGNPWLKSMLVQAAWSAVRNKKSYLRAQFARIRSRRGPKKAIVAVAASMLKAVYFILRDDVPFKDLGAGYYDLIDKNRLKSRLVRKLEGLGFTVELSPQTVAS